MCPQTVDVECICITLNKGVHANVIKKEVEVEARKSESFQQIYKKCSLKLEEVLLKADFFLKLQNYYKSAQCNFCHIDNYYKHSHPCKDVERLGSCIQKGRT